MTEMVGFEMWRSPVAFSVNAFGENSLYFHLPFV